MKTHIIKLVLPLIAGVALGISTVQAQSSSQYRFDNFSQEQGLSNNQVQSIFQDKDGWMWIGTSHGLNRFDGRRFKRYSLKAKSEVIPTGGLVRDIYQDREGVIWVGVERGGLFRLRNGVENFEEVYRSTFDKLSVNSIRSDQNSALWVGCDNGLYAITNQEGQRKITFVDTRKAGITVGAIKKLLVDQKGRIWLGSDKGLFIYQPNAKRLQRVVLSTGGFLNDEVWSLYQDRYKKVWIGTYNSGVYYVEEGALEAQKLQPYPTQDRSQTVKAIIQDKNGDYWFGTRAGLFSYNAYSKRFAHYGHDDDEQTSLGQSSILSLFVDAKGDLWAGTRGGVSYLIDEKKYFTHYSLANSRDKGMTDNEVYAIWPASNNEVWLGTESGGINILNRATDRFTAITTKNSSLKTNCVKWFMPDGKGNVWVSTYMGGISVVSIRTKQVVKTYSSAPQKAGALSDSRVWTTFKDSKNRIWVGTYRGVDLYDPVTDSFVGRRDIAGRSQVNWIDEDEKGDLWFGTNDNLVIYSPEQGRKIVVNQVVRSFAKLGNGKYLLATQGHGVALYEKGRGVKRYYTEADGLANDFTYSIVDDGLGGLWMSTSNGLSRFDRQRGTFMNYYRVDGLQNNQFNYGAYGKTQSGELLFGGINGFNIFNPKYVKANSYKPPVVLTGISIFNEPLRVEEEEGQNEQRVYTMQEVELKHNQNMITFEYAALNYAKANKNKYLYKLEGLEDRWIDAGNQTTVTYSNLAPGTYTFKVKGSNSDGLWNEEGASIKVRINPPFWGTIWFRLLLLIAFLGVVYTVIKFFTNRANLRNKLIFEKAKAKKLHEIDTMKQQFFTNVSHEIRTPLTLIIGPVEKMLENPLLAEGDKNLLGMVRSNALILMKLVNQILDFKKLETGKLHVEYDKGDLVRFVESAIQPFQFMSVEKDIRFKLELPQREFSVWMDADKLGKIINNLLSNAFKFTSQGGEVKLTVALKDRYEFEDGSNRGCYEIAVSDTGRGIPTSSIDNVFNRFFQASNSKGVTGTGIGLSIVKEFVKLLKGDVEVQSEEGEGTTFYVRLPILEDYEVGKEDHTDHPVAHAEDSEAVVASAKYLLVVDDNSDMRTFIREHFRHEFTVLEAENGKVGFEMAVKYIPEVVLSDVLMPVMDGRELCKKLKKDERTSHIPVVLLTAVNSKESEMSGLIAGADDYITKPFDVKILNVKVDNLLLLRNKLREKLKTEILLQPTNISIASPDERFLRKAVEVVEKYMAEPELDIELFSTEVGVSRMQLYRKLEALTNMTVKEFIRDIRLRRAAQLLEQNKITISEVVYAVGFRDLAHFRKCFKDVYGMSPSSYLEKVKNEKKDEGDA
jgi:signal transduction histidine kinase/ligand-binding sensor domain-containing protein/DNA-binding response OmpR family regulator